MSRRWLWAGFVPALAAAALLLTPTQSHAWGRGGYGGYGGYGGGYGGYGYGYGGYRGGYGGWMGGHSPYYSGYGAGWGGYPAYSGYGYTVPNYSLYGGNGGYFGNYNAASNPMYYSSYPQPGYQSSYPPTGVPNGNRNDSHVRVEVPANAEVWFGGFKTSQTGTDRLFVSPPLEPKENYKYEVRARWMENGRTVDRTRNVSIHASETVTVDFLKHHPEDQAVTAPAANPPAIPVGETPTSTGP